MGFEGGGDPENALIEIAAYSGQQALVQDKGDVKVV